MDAPDGCEGFWECDLALPTKGKLGEFYSNGMADVDGRAPAAGADGGGETHWRANKRRAAAEGERMKAGGGGE